MNDGINKKKIKKKKELTKTMERNFQMQLGGRTLIVETGKYAEQAGGS